MCCSEDSNLNNSMHSLNKTYCNSLLLSYFKLWINIYHKCGVGFVFFCYREVDVNFLGTTAPLSHPGKDGASCTQEDLLIYMKDFLSWMAQDTLQYRLLTHNFILSSSTPVFDSLPKHLFIVFFWKMVIQEIKLLFLDSRVTLG